MIAPFRTEHTLEETAINKAMVPIRLPVEWTFGKITQFFAFLDFSKNLKIGVQPVGLFYRVAVLMTNAHTTLYGSNTGTYFGVDAPALDVYFQG